jgi:transposase
VEHLCQHCPEIQSAQAMALRFVNMVKERRAGDLNRWLEDAKNSPIVELQSFAKCLCQDYAAVQAALTSEYSNGQEEGQVNRLKLIKRSMYGRAKLDLLKARVLSMKRAA